MPAADLPPADCALLAAFARHEHGADGLVASTIANHRTYLEAYVRWWRRARPGRELTTAAPGDVAAFLIAEAERGLAPRTRRSELAALRRFCAWLVLTERTLANPAATLPLPKVRPQLLEVYSPEQARAILAHTATLTDLRGRQRHALVATLRFTGMRSAELRTLRLADVDLPGGRARVLAKGGRPRAVLLPAPLRPILERFVTHTRPQLPDSPLLLVNAHPLVTTANRGLGQEALSREVELAALGAAVPGRHHPHKWRHSYATELARAGVDIHVVQRLLGHLSIAATVGYTHLALDDLRAAVDATWTTG